MLTLDFVFTSFASMLHVYIFHDLIVYKHVLHGENTEKRANSELVEMYIHLQESANVNKYTPQSPGRYIVARIALNIVVVNTTK